MSPCQLARSKTRPTADETGNRKVVMRHTQRWTCGGRTFKPRRRTDRSHLERFTRCQIWKHSMERARKHRLPNAWRSFKKQRESTNRGDHHCTNSARLATNLGEIAPIVAHQLMARVRADQGRSCENVMRSLPPL